MSVEEWRDVVGHEGCYQVSNKGRVKSLAKIVNSRFGQRRVPERILKPSVCGKGYLRLSLRNDNWRTKKNYLVHRLVAFAFLECLDTRRKHVNHKDGCKLNNKVDNLEWVTNQENMDHAVKTGLIKNGSDASLAKLNEFDVLIIRDMIKRKIVTQKWLAEKFNVNPQTISKAVTYKTWKHVP